MRQRRMAGIGLEGVRVREADDPLWKPLKRAGKRRRLFHQTEPRGEKMYQNVAKIEGL